MKIRSKRNSNIVNIMFGKIRLMREVKRGNSGGSEIVCIRNQRFPYWSITGWIKAIKWVL